MTGKWAKARHEVTLERVRVALDPNETTIAVRDSLARRLRGGYRRSARDSSGGPAPRKIPPRTDSGDAMPDRERIEPNPDDKRYIRRDDEGRFKEVEDVGRSSSQDQPRDAEAESQSGQGDRGDRKDE